MIYAIDPFVKEVQKLYALKVDYYVDNYITSKKIKHSTYSNIAEAQLDLMQKCIDTVKIWGKNEPS